MQHNPGFIRLVESVRSGIEEIDPQDVQNYLDSAKRFQLIDCRETDEWLTGHIPQAFHLSRGILERDIESHISDFDQTIVLYCGGGYRSALAAANLKQMGYRHVLSMAGGMRRWKEENRPLVIPKA